MILDPCFVLEHVQDPGTHCLSMLGVDDAHELICRLRKGSEHFSSVYCNLDRKSDTESVPCARLVSSSW